MIPTDRGAELKRNLTGVEETIKGFKNDTGPIDLSDKKEDNTLLDDEAGKNKQDEMTEHIKEVAKDNAKEEERRKQQERENEEEKEKQREKELLRKENEERERKIEEE